LVVTAAFVGATSAAGVGAGSAVPAKIEGSSGLEGTDKPEKSQGENKGRVREAGGTIPIHETIVNDPGRIS
jgi:hypothetical protein